MWKFVIIYIFSMIFVEKAQYNSCCFCCKKKKITMQWSHVKTFEFERVQLLLFCFAKRTKNYNAMVSRQNIRIRARTTLVVLFCKKNQKLQCNGLTSKHLNSFVIVFIVWHQFFLFYFCETNFDVFTIFSKLSGLKRMYFS